MLGNVFGGRPDKKKLGKQQHSFPTLGGAFYFTLRVDVADQVDAMVRMHNYFRSRLRFKTDTNLFHRVVDFGRFVVGSSRMKIQI